MRIAAEHVAVPQPDELDATDQFGESMAPARVDLNGFEPTVIRTYPEEPARHTVFEAAPLARD